MIEENNERIMNKWQLRDQLMRNKGKWVTISRQTGINYHWIVKFYNKVIDNPGINYAEKLTRYFDEQKNGSQT